MSVKAVCLRDTGLLSGVLGQAWVVINLQLCRNLSPNMVLCPLYFSRCATMCLVIPGGVLGAQPAGSAGRRRLCQ